MRNVTFNIEKPAYNQVIQEVIRALESLVVLEIDTAPAKSMENIVRIVLTFCIDHSEKIQSIQETMAAMSRFIRELLEQKYRLEALKVEKDKWIEERKSLISQLERAHNGNEVLRETIGDLGGSDREINNELISENADLKSKLQEEKKKKEKRDAEFEDVWNNYTYFKNRVDGLTQRINDQDKFEKRERESQAS